MPKDPMDKLRRLKQIDETWEGTVRLARTWITPKKEAPYRPWLIMFVDQNGRMLASELSKESPTTDTIWKTLSKAMQHPMLWAGRSRRPGIVNLDQEEHVQALAPLLEAIGIRCKFQRNLAGLAEALASMEQWLNRGHNPLPGLITLPGMTLPLLGHLYSAAADFHKAEPWHALSDLHPIEIRYPPNAPARYVVVMGNGREVYGLSVQDSFADLQRILGNVSEQDLTNEMTWLVLSYEEAIAMSFDDLDAIAGYGWPVPSEQAYPVIFRTQPKGQLGLPTRQDMLWLAGALPACVMYFNEHLQLRHGMVRPAELTLDVPILGITEQVYLRLPAHTLTPSEDRPQKAWTGTDRKKSTRKPKSRKKIIERNLSKALLEDGPMLKSLFEYDLEEHIKEFLQSKRADGDRYFIAVTENTNHVAMILLDDHDVVHINEEARAILQKLWQKAYRINLERLIPDMANQLDSGSLYIAGVTIKK